MPITEAASNEHPSRPGFRCRLAPGTELLGQWEGSAFQSAPYLIRRADGQHLQVSALLYQLAASMETESDPRQLAGRLSASTGREVSADNVAHLVRTKLAPLGVAATDDQAAGPAGRANPLLALRFRAAVVPARVHRRVTMSLTFLFRPVVVAAGLMGLAAADTWLGVAHGTAILAGANQIIAHPALLLALTGMTVVAAAIHETGHAAATRAGGATPGVMGAGIYLVWPVFYTDITDSYRLGRAGRLRADLGGVYFNALTLLGAAIAYGVTHWPLLLVFIVVTHMEVLSQFLPFVRLDGYWVVSDLIGVPNLFAYLGPTLARLLRRSNPAVEARLGQIRPWAQRVIAAWVIATAAVLAVDFLVAAWLGPRLVAAAIGAIGTRSRHLGLALARDRFVVGADDLVSIVFLILPAAGLLYIGGLLLTRVIRALLRWRRTRPLAAAALAAALAALASYQGFSVAGSYTDHGTPPAARYRTTAASPPYTARAPGGGGTWTVGPDGSVRTTGHARYYGSASAIRLTAPTVAIAATPDGRGYWLAGADGGVFAFGDARFYGSVAALRLDGPVETIAATPDGGGYWLAATDGGVFAFGDAGFYGSLGAVPLGTPVVGMAPSAGGRGYWLAGADGRVFAFGTAGRRATAMGAGPSRLALPVTGLASTAAGFEVDTPAGARRFGATNGPAPGPPSGTLVEVSPGWPPARAAPPAPLRGEERGRRRGKAG